jgi:hypothetical protein
MRLYESSEKGLFAEVFLRMHSKRRIRRRAFSDASRLKQYCAYCFKAQRGVRLMGGLPCSAVSSLHWRILGSRLSSYMNDRR